MTQNNDLARKNRRVLTACTLAVGGMVGISFAAVPLYNLFCRVTGYGGTTQVAQTVSDQVYDRVITVRFDATTNPTLPWRFQPVQREMTLRVGETRLAYYRAQSVADARTLGTATFNVTPLKAGRYFAKIECFCFTEQYLDPGAAVDMPVSFYVDPAILEDDNLDDVNTITLSYIFFPMEIEGEETATLDGAASLN